MEPPPPVSIDLCLDWWVWTSARSRSGFAPWKMMTRADALLWGQMRPGAYASMQSYPERHAKGESRNRDHASLLWLDFDGADLGESARAAFRAFDFIDRELRAPGMHEYQLLTIRYSGNRSIHMGVELQCPPAPNLTTRYKALATAWKDAGHAPLCDLAIFTEPRLLPIPGSIRYNTGRRIVVLTTQQLLDACAQPEGLARRAWTEGNHP